MQLTIPVFIYAKPDSEEEAGYTPRIFSTSDKYYSSYEDIKLNEEPLNIQVSMPDLTPQELRMRAIASLQDKQKEVLAEAEKERQHLQELINKLLFLEYKPNQVGDIQ